MLVWEKSVKNLESKVSAAVVGETQTRERNPELAFYRLVGEDTQRSRITDAQALVIASLDGLDTGFMMFVMRLVAVKDKLRLDLTTLVPDSLRAACKELINLEVADFPTASVDTFAIPAAGPVPARKFVPSMSVALMDCEVVSSDSVPVPANDGDANVIEKVAAVLIVDESPSYSSALNALNAPFLTRAMMKSRWRFSEILHLLVKRAMLLLFH